MKLRISVEIRDEEVIKKLNDLKKATSDLRPAFRDTAVYMKTSVLKNFEVEGRPKKWAPLSPKYATWKRKKGYSTKILERTGRLKQSINVSYTNKEARVYTGVKYGAYLHKGTRKMPARPFMLIQDEDVPKIVDIFDRHIKKVIG